MKSPLEMLRQFQDRSTSDPDLEPDPSIEQKLDGNLKTWPPLQRYLVAELELHGLGRLQAVAIVRAAVHNATASDKPRITA